MIFSMIFEIVSSTAAAMRKEEGLRWTACLVWGGHVIGRFGRLGINAKCCNGRVEGLEDGGVDFVAGFPDAVGDVRTCRVTC